jgi:AcrR family transcriptional regulator
MERAAGTEPPGRKGRAPHRRSEQARLAVLRAADDLLVERGFGGVTIEGIAERAGVAKQTIYRWWSSKGEVLLDTLIQDSDERLSIPDSGSAVEDLRRHLRRYATFVLKDPAGRVMLALVGEAQHDREMASALRSRYLEPTRQRWRRMLERGVERGELPRELVLDDALDALYGPVLYRALLGDTKISRAFTDGLVRGVLGPVADVQSSRSA